MRVSVDWYPAVMLTAVVAGVFSVIICALLLLDFTRRSVTDPIDSQQLTAFRAQLRQRPDDPQLQAAARQLDLKLRQQYFRQRDFTTRGAYLLLAAVAVLLITSRMASTLRRKLPQPPREPVDPDSQLARLGLRTMAVLIGLLVFATLGVSMTDRSPLPRRLADLAASVEPSVTAGTDVSPDPTAPVGDQPNAAQPAATVVAAEPTAEEYQQSWPRFRGPRGDGVSAYPNIPTVWDAPSGKGILWKTPIPLPGNSSPIVWGNRVFVTGATQNDREVYCLDAETGSVVWKSKLTGSTVASPAPDDINEDTGYAAPTAATDGRRVFAMFLNGDVAAFDFTGKQLWLRSLGLPDNPYGHASSLATYGDLVIVQMDQGSAKDDKSKLLALRGDTGQSAWEVARPVQSCWATPIVVQHDGQPRIFTNGDPWVNAYDPTDGREIWRVGRRGQDVASSPVYANGLVYIASEFPGVWAIRAGGEGDVTKTQVKWMVEFGAPDTTSPLIDNGLVLLAASFGTLTCYDAEKTKTDDEPLWEEDFDGSFSASPGLVEDRVYLFSVEGKAWVVTANHEGCQRISENELGEECVTCPAFQDGRMYVRGKQNLFCIGSGGAE